MPLKLKRLCAGSYVTLDGEYEIHSWERPEKDDYGPAGEVQWYWRHKNGVADDRYDTKREAVAALEYCLAHPDLFLLD